MKNKSLLMIASLLMLCSCGKEKLPLTSSFTSFSSSTLIEESTIPEPLLDWREESIEHMNQAIGEKLPFVSFTPYYVDESYEDNGEFIFYVRDPASFGKALSYRDALLENGFDESPSSHVDGSVVYLFSKMQNGNKEICVELQNYVVASELRLMAYSRIKSTSWPLKEITSVVGFEITIPSFEATEYYIYPNQEKHEITLYIPQDNNDCVVSYRELLVNEGWDMVDGGEATPYFASQKNYEIEFLYSSPYFEILIRYNGMNPPLIDGDIVITHQWFNDAGQGYQDVEFSYGGISFMSSKMAKIKINGENIVQMKKAESYLKNMSAVKQGIASIRIDVVNVKEEPYRGKITVYAMDESGNKTRIDEENQTYDLNGAPYFMIANESNFVFYFRSLSIELVK